MGPKTHLNGQSQIVVPLLAIMLGSVMLIAASPSLNNMFEPTGFATYGNFSDSVEAKAQIEVWAGSSLQLDKYNNNSVRALLLLDNGSALPGKEVEFYVNGSLISSVTTDESGYAILITNFTEGMKAVFEGDSYIEDSEALLIKDTTTVETTTTETTVPENETNATTTTINVTTTIPVNYTNATTTIPVNYTNVTTTVPANYTNITTTIPTNETNMTNITEIVNILTVATDKEEYIQNETILVSGIAIINNNDSSIDISVSMEGAAVNIGAVDSVNGSYSYSLTADFNASGSYLVHVFAGNITNSTAFVFVLPETAKDNITPVKTEYDTIDKGWKKHVTLDSTDHYYNYSVSTQIPEGIEDFNLRLFLDGQDVTDDPSHMVRFLDTDNNGFKDTVTWVVPSLSRKEYVLQADSCAWQDDDELGKVLECYGDEPEFSIDTDLLDNVQNTSELWWEGCDSCGCEVPDTAVYMKDIKEEIAKIKTKIELTAGKLKVRIKEKVEVEAGTHKIVIKSGNEQEEIWFRFGLITINTEKPIYRPGETARILMVVLDREGYPVDEADVHLSVTAPNGTITQLSSSDNTIRQIDWGTYEASYVTSQEGNYTLFATAESEGVRSHVSSHFMVKEFYEFDILREAPLKIDPKQGPFGVSIEIVSFVNTSTFTLREYLPSVLTVIDSGGAEVTTTGETTVLEWSGLANNSEVTYIAEAPWI